jgi:hypothetical protein
MADVTAGATFLEVVVGSVGQTQCVIKLSEGQKTGVGGDGGPVKFQADAGIELEPERAFSPSPIRCLQDAYAIYLQRVIS